MGPVSDDWIPEALAAGVPAEQLELHLQPVHTVVDGALVGAETFVRWRHPEHGWVPIQRWYAEAARTGALVDLSRKMLPAWAAGASQHPNLVTSFNFSAEQLLDDPFLDAALSIAGSAPRLAVEVDHSVFQEAVVADLSERLAALVAGGFEIWLDDFGESEVDEAAAHHPSVRVVKLDRSLLGADATWLRSLVGRLHDDGKTVLLEGIENDDHVRFARGADVDWGQGFRYAPPLPAAAFAEHALAPPV